MDERWEHCWYLADAVIEGGTDAWAPLLDLMEELGYESYARAHWSTCKYRGRGCSVLDNLHQRKILNDQFQWITP